MTASDPAPRSVLVVDDDDAIREVARVALEVVGGWTVRTATSGPEAVAAARADPPDALLLDVMMPSLDGPGTVALLRADPRTADVPVIFLTAKARTGTDGGWDGARVAGVIAKPFDPITLPGEMSRLLGWRP